MDIGPGITFGRGIYIDAGDVYPTALYGQQAYVTSGTYTWVVPAGVRKVNVVLVGGGGAGARGYNGSGGAGGNLLWVNDIDVTPGESITVSVGAGGTVNADGVDGNPGGNSYFRSATYISAGGGGGGRRAPNNSDVPSSNTGVSVNTSGYPSGGGLGGIGQGRVAAQFSGGGGGGAGGYSGNGGNGSAPSYGTPSSATAGQGGGGGGGGSQQVSNGMPGNGGGGVGILGEGASGAAGGENQGGRGGSGGNSAVDTYFTAASPGAEYGGGGGGGTNNAGYATPSAGAGGAVRIIWGTYNANSSIIGRRSFPSTLTGDL